MVSRFALRVEYEGTAYAGSQLQKTEPTIQGKLESALRQLTNQDLRVDLAGRTDAGVHAVGQVAAFSSELDRDGRWWLGALNGVLPRDIAVASVVAVPFEFDPRRDAKRRWYRYSVISRPSRPALARLRAWHVPAPLDLEAMRTGASQLAGRHDFASFCGALDPGRTTIRTIFSSCLSRSYETLRYDVVGDAFLPQQIRRMVGALVRIGEGKMSLPEFTATLEKAEHGSSNHVAPPHGLCLMNVEYEGLDLGVRNYEDV